MADESAEVTLNNNNSFQLVQPFKSETVATNTTIETVEIKPLSQTSSETFEIKPLSQTSNETLELKPVKIDGRQELVLDPIRTDANSTLDLKPIALDVCMRTGQASLPPTHVCEPYHHRIAFTLMGVEVFGMAISGDSQTIVEDRGGRPMVAWGGVVPAPRAYEAGLPVHHVEHPKPHRHEGGRRHEGRHGSGLRIRLPD